MIEGLAKKIGYNKVRSFTSVGDPHVLNDFIQKTGMKVKIYVAPEVLAQNGIDGVPVTIIETTAGQKIRFDGMTENFIGQPAGGAAMPYQAVQPGQGLAQGGGKQCGK